MQSIIWTELKRSMTRRTLCMALLLPLIILLQFNQVRTGYVFLTWQGVFEESAGTIIAVAFPLLCCVLYLPTVAREIDHQFIRYARTRVSLKDYLIAKGVVNALITFTVFFVTMLGWMLFLRFVEPSLHWMTYEQGPESLTTFTQVFTTDGMYMLAYAGWIGLNAMVYATIAYLLLVLSGNLFLAVGLPFLFYHLLNFATGLLSAPQFSPISTIFPFNIIAMPLWTIFVPFSVLGLMLIGLMITGVKRTEWEL
ncbi:hypothetical protein [Exiguobacterium sp. KRL4]|uniref:hypothetical protein n=1 Tax=Exiguobacterium sp. KRL4 TaxID=1914536 RepID=UPI0009F38E1E|nr:hypothetical protein [Exiguobacterium sp. KRL4]